MVVRSQEYLTIWVEDKIQSALRQNNKMNNKKAVAQNNDSVSTEKVLQKYRGRAYEKETIVQNNDSVPTKKVTKRYRGRVYDEEVVDWSQMQPTSQPKKPRRKYRGQYID